MMSVALLALLAAASGAAPQGQVGAPQPAPIGYLTAGQLADKCAETDASSVSYCFAYVAAVHDTARAYEIWLAQREFCTAADVSQADLRRSFLGYLAAYPQNRGGQAASVIVVALKETYPCAVVPKPAPTPDASVPSTKAAPSVVPRKGAKR